MVLIMISFLGFSASQSSNQTIITDDGSLSLTFNTIKMPPMEDDSDSYEGPAQSFLQAYWRLKQPPIESFTSNWTSDMSVIICMQISDEN